MIIAIIQARMSSNRLPKKVLMELHGKPILQWVIEAARAATTVDKVVVATSNKIEDQEIINFANKYADTFAGDLNNVLNRFYEAAKQYNPTHIVRLTADCPLLKEEIIDATVRYHLLHNNDYTRNFDFCSMDDADIDSPNRQRIGYPSGFDVEVFTYNSLVRANKLAVSDFDCEHVTPFMHNHLFKKSFYIDGEMPGKWSIDTMADYENVADAFFLFKSI